MKTILDASEETGLEVNEKKAKYMLLSGHQNARQNPYIKRENRSFENVSQFKYSEKAVINQILIPERIKGD
jgi:hypothetical protein